ncbi:MAG: hypothetical protein V1862_02590, partial [Methanobacteriota archaeon]
RISACLYGDDAMKRRTQFLLLLIIISTTSIAGCSQPQTGQPTLQPIPAQSSDTIGTTNSSLGTILVDAQGNTLYYFAKDTPANNTSSCNGQCAVIWPIFSVDTITVSPPLMVSDFSTIIREDGKKQTSYRGWPLYYYMKDTKPGDVSGENVTQNWFVVKPDETVMILQQDKLGSFLTDRTGKTLYYFMNDSSMTSVCIDTCLEKWPAFNADTVSSPSLLKSADFTSVTRTDGVKQTAFMGRPLYYFAADTKPSDVKGEGINNVWVVANVSGIVPVASMSPTAIPPITPSTIKPTSSPSSGYSSGY